MAYARKENIDAVRFMRVAAMLLVVLIHATVVGLSNTPTDSPMYAYYLALNRFTRFEGAVFVFLSGLVLFYTYEARPYTTKVWKAFYKKRFLFILVPYVIWSAFYEWFSIVTGERSYDGMVTMIARIATGQSYYQLYFILILVQFYFLLPIFMWLYKKVPFFQKHMVLIGIVVELLMAYLTQLFDWQFVFPIFTVYIASFLLGAWVAIHYQQVKNCWTGRKLSVAILGVAMIGVIYTYSYYIRNILGQWTLGYIPFKLINILYFLAACYVLFKACIWLVRYGGKMLNTIAERLRIYSFGYYLVHPFILYIVSEVIVAHTRWQFHLFILIRYIIVVILCYVFIRLIHRIFPKVWMFFGNLPPIQKQKAEQ